MCSGDRATRALAPTPTNFSCRLPQSLACVPPGPPTKQVDSRDAALGAPLQCPPTLCEC